MKVLNFKEKPIIAMLHLKGRSNGEIMERMIKEGMGRNGFA